MDLEAYEAELTRERRARLAAERMLELKEAQLGAANRQLSDHALALSGQIMDQRKVVNTLQGENTRVVDDLQRANTKVVAMEKLLWAALETIPDGFALFGPDFRLVAANRPYLDVFDGNPGIQPGVSYQTILDACLDDGIVDLQGQEEDAWYDQMLDRWDAATITPVHLRLWNGVYVKMVDRRTSDGGVVSLALNVTDNIRREAELVDARDKAEAADKAKSIFLAKMSHELRTPMNGVVGMAELLGERGLDDEAQLYTETIRSSGQALLDIINNILDFSKIGAETFELKQAPFDLEQLVQDVCLVVGPSLRGKPVELLTDYDQFLPTGFIGDAGRIRQVLLNLVGNAAKFTDEGTILLRVVGLSRTPGHYDLHITVEDTGIGIPPDKTDHIFGEFNQIEEDTNRQYEGTGLGLSITRKLVDCMGGTMWLDSLPGQGSSFGFKITVPATADDDHPKADLPAALKHVIVWTESTLDRSLLDRQLKLLGVEVWFVENASEFDLAINRRAPNIAICAPQQRAAAERMLGRSCPKVPIVTAAASMGEEADLPKPFTRIALHRALCDVLVTLTPSPQKGGLQVLAAEDNKTNQFVLTKMLNGLDIELTLVDDGIEAVNAFKKGQFDLILMDVSMPRMDGLEATAAIRAHENGRAHVPIVAMTAHALPGDRDRILSSGFDHYMAKPLSKGELAKQINDIAAELGAAVPA